MSSLASLGYNIFSNYCFWWLWQLCGVLVRYFCRKLPQLEFVWCFSNNLGERDNRCHSYHIIARVHTIKSTNIKCWWSCGKNRKNSPTLLVGCKLVQPLWRTVWMFLKKTKNRTTIWSCDPTPGHISRENHKRSKRCIYPNIHCSTIYDSQDMEHIYCIYIYVCVCIYTVKYYSGTRKNKITPFAATWMGLDMIILRDVSQIEKDKHHLISLICGI